MDQVTVSRELLRQVLDAFETYAKQYPGMWKGYLLDAEQALREALEQPAVEPLTVHQIRLSDATWVNCCETTFDYHNRMGWKTRVLETYTAPKARQPQVTVHSHTVRTLPNGNTEGFAFVTSPEIKQPQLLTDDEL